MPALHKRPPCDSRMERLMDSPVPVPSHFMVKNALDMWAACCENKSQTNTIGCSPLTSLNFTRFALRAPVGRPSCPVRRKVFGHSPFGGARVLLERKQCPGWRGPLEDRSRDGQTSVLPASLLSTQFWVCVAQLKSEACRNADVCVNDRMFYLSVIRPSQPPS